MNIFSSVDSTCTCFLFYKKCKCIPKTTSQNVHTLEDFLIKGNKCTYSFMRSILVLLSLSLTHMHTQTHKAARHVATCQAVSRLHCCDSIFSLWSVTVQMMIIRELCLHLITDITNWVSLCLYMCVSVFVCIWVCVFFPSCSGVLLRLDVDIVLSFSVTLIVFEWPVTAEVCLVLSDVIYHSDWQQKKQQYDCFFVLSFFSQNAEAIQFTCMLTHITWFLMNKSCAKLRWYQNNTLSVSNFQNKSTKVAKIEVHLYVFCVSLLRPQKKCSLKMRTEI